MPHQCFPPNATSVKRSEVSSPDQKSMFHFCTHKSKTNMVKKCEYCQSEFTSKRVTRKYCSDNCKQMAYFKRSGTTLGELKLEPTTLLVPTIKDAKTIQQDILNDIAVKVMQLIELREAEQKQSIKSHVICNVEPFSFNLKNKSQK